MKGRRGRSLFFIDIAVPRDIDPAVNDLANVYLYDIDDLQKVVETNLKGRMESAEDAEAIGGAVVETAPRGDGIRPRACGFFLEYSTCRSVVGVEQVPLGNAIFSGRRRGRRKRPNK